MDATEISIRFIYPLYFRNSTISVQRKGVGRTWLIIYHATYNLYNGNKPKTELLRRKQLVCYNRGQKVDLLHAWWKPFAKINKRQKQIILKEVETIRNTYMKANNAFAIFFFIIPCATKLITHKWEDYSKLIFTRMQDLYNICQECKTLFFLATWLILYTIKTHGLFFVFDHKWKHKCGTI